MATLPGANVDQAEVRKTVDIAVGTMGSAVRRVNFTIGEDSDGDQTSFGQHALVILGDVSIQGNIKGVRTLMEPCQLAMENGAHRVLVPIENRRQFLEVSRDVAERLDPVFYGEAPVAANKALAIT